MCPGDKNKQKHFLPYIQLEFRTEPIESDTNHSKREPAESNGSAAHSRRSLMYQSRAV